MHKLWFRSRRNQVVLAIALVVSIFYYLTSNVQSEANLDVTRRESVIEFIERRLEQTLKDDKGTGCEIPKLDPFAKEVAQFDVDMPKVVCSGEDWVKCYLSECKVVPRILETTRHIVCTYNDILYETDDKYTIGPPIEVRGSAIYVLTKSDYVKISCNGNEKNSNLPTRWKGFGAGYRETVIPKTPPPGRENTYNILLFGFDSTSRNGFIRRMPKSYKVLMEELGATVLHGYNILGDGTPAALFPILTGKTELELPDVRKKAKGNETLDSMPFIFYKLAEDGYHTAYYEDMPWIGTFQYRFKGFKRQPADHYLRAFFMEESAKGKKWWRRPKQRYCVGDTPQYKLMFNLTEQLFKLDGKKFCFTFVADITHDDFNYITTADEDTVDFLRNFLKMGRGEDTMLLVFGDHGPRYAKVRATLQGKLEERLPLMAIRLPDALRRRHPHTQTSLEANVDVLTTAHDIHATILDAMDLRKYWNPYKINGADLTRGLTLLEEIPKNRSCSEAGIEPHWCSCLSWENVSPQEVIYTKTANALVDYINLITEYMRLKCELRTLTSIEWVMRQRVNNGVLTFVGAKDADGYVGKFGAKVPPSKENYQVKITVGPGSGVYEASMTYIVKEDKFYLDSRDISRTNAYNNEPSCISEKHPHLNSYCFCKEQ
ncbi:uncharacterized protein LOC126975740 isoform X2 [Leptidea sinapis]|uniref:Uncharacterized protein n=1 Tax=Leptidea sinapis TaxID=189913 RepID=A0A5E4QUR9_9NEOP|nr:uncharacterized protein LOC126975740 isoform X2 [Leptidea sinapis]VVD00671.1 unnamed protein product [Leptidea sinapis]